MTEQLTLQLQTLTPLWTGGVDGAMDRIHESGILGGLRWWYEAIVRGLGGRACDPTEHRCSLSGDNLKAYEQAIKEGKTLRQALSAAKVCDACQLFGATGWRRRFRLNVTPGQGATVWTGSQPINLRPHDRTRGWYLSPGWMGELMVTLTGEDQAVGEVAALLLFLEEWGGIGAKQQFGYGLFRCTPEAKAALSRQARFTLPGGQGATAELPDLRDFTFFQARLRPQRADWWAQVDSIRQVRHQRPDQWQSLTQLAQQGAAPISAAIKNAWRFGQPWPSRQMEEWLFGALRHDKRLRSRVNPGWAVRQGAGAWSITGWIWLPHDAESRPYHDQIADQMQRLLADRTGWQRALGLVGAVHSLEVTLTNGLDAWNTVAQTTPGGVA